MVYNRIFICADVKFPHGDAGSNRILYVAKAMIEAGYQTVLFSCGVTTKGKAKKYENVPFINITKRKNKILRIIDSELNHGNLVVRELEKFNLNFKDIIYIYGSNSFFVNSIMKYALKNNIKTCIDVVEWHQPYQYRYGKFDIRYLSINRTFEKLAPKIGNIVAISNCIKLHYNNVHSMVLPVVVDTRIKYNIEKCTDDINLIYAGNPCREDAIVMLKALRNIVDMCHSKIRLHLTGVKKEKIQEQLGDDTLLTYLQDVIVYHGWLDYSEFEDLMLKMDFLFMSRPNDLVKKANFPSKLPELMARGIVPICNRVGDFYLYLNDGIDSIMFDDSNEAECTDALKRVISMEKDDITQLKLNARKTAEKYFDYRKWIKTITDFIEEI